MPRGNSRKPQQSSPASAVGVLRMAKAIPTIERQAAGPVKAPEPSVVVDNGLPCSGRCGHCDCHPCQLHAPI
ncbi:hypothetical protein [Geothrix sp. PMB-07]|uniref:hypothetical protein n=1 Tax=Geothrix sp. PMB-07 TaxID=3068640 RepID=UPI002742892F|nr:hypothetical protein [Geothrix sp. PMB-07]WLT30163.1 hypothetical protein Q9293_10580 [Geothrix sp. PMB-07]